LAILREVTALLIRSIWWVLKYGRPIYLYETVRLRIEYSTFHGDADSRQTPDASGVLKNIYWNKVARLHSKTSDAGPDYAIPMKTCNDIYEHSAEIQHYLETLGAQNTGDPIEFLAEVEVRNGFVAPLLLLTGLLHNSDDDWATIIDAYGRDVNPTADPLSDGLKSDFLRRLQTFQFDCWLLWGPSIPVCGNECYYWKGQIGALQYGYGDENNSIALIGDNDKIRATMKSGERRSALAIRTSAQGRLKLSGNVAAEKVAEEISPALRTAWQTEDDKRVVLDLRPEHRIRLLSGSEDNARTTYYSAYLWVLFIIFENGNPIHTRHETGPLKAWRSFLPFFEHGNIAEDDVSEFMKNQLARKAVRALNAVVEQYEEEWKAPFPLQFAYACSIDDSGCGVPPAHGANSTRDGLRKYLVKAVSESPGLRGRGIVDFEVYDPAIHPSNHPYSACSLPSLLAKYYPDHKSD
jgi:hypothetical protein